MVLNAPPVVVRLILFFCYEMACFQVSKRTTKPAIKCTVVLKIDKIKNFQTKFQVMLFRILDHGSLKIYFYLNHRSTNLLLIILLCALRTFSVIFVR